MKDDKGLGIVIGIGVLMFDFLVFTFSIGPRSTSGFESSLMQVLQWLMLPCAIAIPVVLYIKGYRKVMKAYLLTLLVPIVLVLLLFGSCLMIIR